jgi:tRNA dimethylallyltransferase
MRVEKRSRPEIDIVLLAGPTASGKSRLALAHAAAAGAWVVNADSMQVYRDLRVLTARPSLEDEQSAPHRLYGHVDGAIRYSVGAWLGDFSDVLTAARNERRPLIVVGGTGLYFKALTEGLAEMPSIPADLRARALAETAGLTAPEAHERLRAIDPEDAAAIRPSDRSRIVRALEVMRATGRPLAEWQRAARQQPLLGPASARRIVLLPDRADLASRIAGRAEAMLAGSAVPEVAALLARNLPPELPVMKAIGVRQIADHLAGRLSLEAAAAAISLETRQYAKRQMTWLRNQMGDWERLGSTLDLPRLPA